MLRDGREVRDGGIQRSRGEYMGLLRPSRDSKVNIRTEYGDIGEQRPEEAQMYEVNEIVHIRTQTADDWFVNIGNERPVYCKVAT